jgi:hypothetical protein
MNLNLNVISANDSAYNTFVDALDKAHEKMGRPHGEKLDMALDRLMDAVGQKTNMWVIIEGSDIYAAPKSELSLSGLEKLARQERARSKRGARESLSRTFTYDEYNDARKIEDALYMEGYQVDLTGPHREINPNTREPEKYWVVKTDAPRKIVLAVEDELNIY